MKPRAPTPAAEVFDLPVFEQPQIERPRRSISWEAVMVGTEAVRRHFREHFDHPEVRLRDKNSEPFRME
jgi:hypothetical protein